MSDLKDNKVILANAPEVATHWDGSYYYIVNGGANKSSKIWNVISPIKWHEGGNLRLNDLIDMRSLADIAEIVSLREQLAQAQKQLATAKADGIREAIIDCGVDIDSYGGLSVDYLYLIDYLEELTNTTKDNNL